MSDIKKTLLEIVQDILSDTDGEEVNSISDSIEAQQAATIVEHTFYDILSNRDVPEHTELMQFTAFADSDFPTHFEFPENTLSIGKVWYDTTANATAAAEYDAVEYLDNETFLELVDSVASNYVLVFDANAASRLRIRNDRFPKYYTSFDDENIVMDSYHATYESTLTSARTRVMAKVSPVFNRTSDTYIPDIDQNMFPYLIAESRARFMDWYKGGASAKAEQWARRLKVGMQGNRLKTPQGNRRNHYGR